MYEHTSITLEAARQRSAEIQRQTDEWRLQRRALAYRARTSQPQSSLFHRLGQVLMMRLGQRRPLSNARVGV